jgi:DNA polymerase-3 subunit gamma/tau
MSYLAFALKYRPQNFQEIVGQEQIIATLRNAILKKRVHHAYLFAGPRGVGKTSLARIFAKSLNCFEGPTLNPCGKCTSCVEITQGRSLDIIEIDGASNRGIDEIKTLRENIKLSTTYSRYKIYIIDEVHMLTQEAFNALLKTLEEPPAHVKFIFATTHVHKVLPTILSRCQKFQFNLISLEKIVAKLKKIAKAENIKINEDLLYTIARSSEGSIRDAESLFDQLTPVVLEKGSIEDIFSFLGVIEESTLNELLKYLLDKNLAACIDFIDKIIASGKDLDIFLDAFIEHLRGLLIAKISPKTFNELGDVSSESKSFILSLTKQISVTAILKILDSLIEAKNISQRLVSVRIPLELALIKYLHKEDSEAPVRKEENKANRIKTAEFKSQNQKIEEDIDFDLAIPDDNLQPQKPEVITTDKAKETKEDTANGAKDNMLLAVLEAKWKEIINYLQKTRAALASHFSFGRPFFSQGNLIAIAFAPQDSFHKETVEVPKNLKFIEEVISKFMSKEIKIKFLTDNSVESSSGTLTEKDKEAKKRSKEAKKDSGEDDSFLNEILDTFDARFHNDDE